MFGKLKDKLKQSLSIFSKKTEEEAEEKEVVEEIIEEIVDKPKKEVKLKEVKSEKLKLKEVKEDKKVKLKEVKLEEVKEDKKEILKEKRSDLKEKKVEEPIVLEPIVPEPTSEPKEEPKEDKKKGFFGKLFSKEKEDIPLEEADKVIKKDLEETSKETIKEKVKEKVKEEPSSELEPEEPETLDISKDEINLETESLEEEKKGFFKKIKQTITTKTISEEKFEDLFWDLELTLLENNVSVEIIERIKTDLKEELVNKPLPRDVEKKIQDTLKSTLTDILTFKKPNLIENVKAKENKPYIIAFFGINGAGKTTSIAKLANYFQENKLSVVLAACDTFRAAAIHQLEEHANKLNIKIIKHDYGSDAAAVAFDAIKYAEKNKIDVVLIDTAGRLHSNINLMGELEKICRVTKPDFKIFTAEAITGNDAVEQSQQFNGSIGVDGIILTKADIDDKGGAIVSVSHVTKKPILFLGVGQEYKDFEEFSAKVVLERLGF